MIVKAAELEERQQRALKSASVVSPAGTGGPVIIEGNEQRGVIREGLSEPLVTQTRMLGMENEEKKLHSFYGSVQISERMMASDSWRRWSSISPVSVEQK